MIILIGDHGEAMGRIGDIGLADGLAKKKSITCQPVHVRCFNFGVTIAPHPVRPQGIYRNEEHQSGFFHHVPARRRVQAGGRHAERFGSPFVLKNKIPLSAPQLIQTHGKRYPGKALFDELK